jgi:hypothetical protein
MVVLSVRLLGYVKKPTYLPNPLAAAGLVRGPAAVRDIVPRTILNSKSDRQILAFFFPLPALIFFCPFLSYSLASLSLLVFLNLSPPIFLFLVFFSAAFLSRFYISPDFSLPPLLYAHYGCI